ncbi:MAG: hypothetical protein JSV97_01860 [candidate division WOR-3 bacterium]|nr:MAG: hypothetical protein JSV97_01860 [candidate division WOR-3 bacterium]
MMFKKIVASLTLICVIVCVQGCYSKQLIDRRELRTHPGYEISTVVTVDGNVFEFAPDAVLTDSIVRGITKDGAFKEIPLSQINMVYIRKFNPVTSCLTAIGVTSAVIGIGFLIILATKESCPFVYSFNGEQYIFDGEPYGGAICEGLQRTDLCKLEHLRPVDGEYRIQLANEVNETQYTDEFKLWVVDHSPEVDVIQDAKGNLYTVAARHRPLMVVDSRGENLHAWLSEKDLLVWESDMLDKDPKNDADLRDTLFLAFLRPPQAEKAKPIVLGCNSLWASQMLMRMVALCGSHVKQLYEKLKNPGASAQRDAWCNWTEIYALHVYIWANGDWVRRGVIIGSGPFIAEERIVPLDLEGVEGDTVKIQLAPPTGFWQFNSFAMDYSAEVPFEMQEISASSMVGHNGKDLCATLESADRKYYVMPDIGQHAVFTFPVPALKPDNERVVFAKVSGYYEMHLNASGPPRFDKIHRILSEPNYVVKFALEEYHKWHNELVSKFRD